MHCQRYHSEPATRREMLLRCASGFGGLAMTALLRDPAFGEALKTADDPLTPRPPHFTPRARNVIFLYMDGGPSQMDTFDPKPRLDREHGQPIKVKTHPTQFNNVGNVLRSPWTFRPYGESGIPVSDLFRHVGECVDDLAIVRSMVSNFSEHTSANYFLHTGSGLQGRPSHGAWVTYGLGSECRDLPGFVVLNGGLIPPGGLDCFNSGFLPASYQGSIFKAGANPVANIEPTESSTDIRDRKLRAVADPRPGGPGPDRPPRRARVGRSPTTSWPSRCRPRCRACSTCRVNRRRPSSFTVSTRRTRPPRSTAGSACWPDAWWSAGSGSSSYSVPRSRATDGTSTRTSRTVTRTTRRAVDQPIAALLKDLKARGLLESTLVVWGGEFGRTPMAQGSNGRDHNPYGFTMWLAGGGIKGGTIHGATDDYGYHAVENKVEVHDLHATILHLLGIDHKRLTFRFSGRDMRLTDVHGEIVTPIIA